jgi:hypothetical protein
MAVPTEISFKPGPRKWTLQGPSSASDTGKFSVNSYDSDCEELGVADAIGKITSLVIAEKNSSGWEESTPTARISPPAGRQQGEDVTQDSSTGRRSTMAMVQALERASSATTLVRVSGKNPRHLRLPGHADRHQRFPRARYSGDP